MPLVNELGWEDEGTHLEKYLRGAVLRSAVFHNDTEAVKKALTIFNDWMVNKKHIPANLRSTIYLAGKGNECISLVRVEKIFLLTFRGDS